MFVTLYLINDCNDEYRFHMERMVLSQELAIGSKEVFSDF